MGQNQPPNKWVSAVICCGAKWAEHETHHSPPRRAKLKE
jgi:hypothetical protein